MTITSAKEGAGIAHIVDLEEHAVRRWYVATRLKE